MSVPFRSYCPGSSREQREEVFRERLIELSERKFRTERPEVAARIAAEAEKVLAHVDLKVVVAAHAAQNSGCRPSRGERSPARRRRVRGRRKLRTDGKLELASTPTLPMPGMAA